VNKLCYCEDYQVDISTRLAHRSQRWVQFLITKEYTLNCADPGDTDVATSLDHPAIGPVFPALNTDRNIYLRDPEKQQSI